LVQKIVDHAIREELVYLSCHLCSPSIFLGLVNQVGRAQALELNLPHVSIYLEDMQ